MTGPTDTVRAVLDLARWAPSTDNTQPWRFELRPDGSVVVHGFDTRTHCVYDLDGRVSQLSLGALLETIRIAASQFGLMCNVRRRPGLPETQPTFEVAVTPDAGIARDSLIDSIRARTVQRRPLRTRPLTGDEQAELRSSVRPAHDVVWLAGWRNRLHMSRTLYTNGKLRLRMPEAHAVHSTIIEWDAVTSDDRMPDAAIGLDPLTLRLTRWAMPSWERLAFLDRYLAGTVVPCLELDFIPGLACAAHFVILAPGAPATVADYVAGGGALQRLWLTATRLGLQLQPEMSPLVFARYLRQGTRFTQSPHCEDLAARVATRLNSLLGTDVLNRAVFMGRIGAGRTARARSTRLPLDRLLVPGVEDGGPALGSSAPL